MNLILSVGDGQSYTDGDLTVNGTLLGSNQFPGGAGALWDMNSYDITSVLSPGDNVLAVSHESKSDCLQFVSAIVDKEAETPVLFLDFDTAIPVDYQVVDKNPLAFLFDSTPAQKVLLKNGSEPLTNFTDAQKAQLVSLAQGVFDRSGIAMEATSTRPSSGDYTSVRFSGDRIVYDSDGDGYQGRLLGQAYQGIDRFDTNKNDIVAVLMNENDDLGLIANTIVHESGHAMGARHINPLEGNGEEVMDYHDVANEKFYDKVAFITEPPNDGNDSTSTTHNPTYHLRRYVGGESHDQLIMDGIKPGSWDQNFKERIEYLLETIGTGDQVKNLSVATVMPNALIEGDDIAPVIQLTPLTKNAEGNYVFMGEEGQEFYIVGSDTEGGPLNTVLDTTPGDKEKTPFIVGKSGPLSGTFKKVADNGDETNVGTAGLKVTKVDKISGEEIKPQLMVSVTPEEISENGGTATVTISRGTATDGDLEVVLSSSDTSEAVLDGVVTIPDGDTEVTVTLTALDDGFDDGPMISVITAQADGYTSGRSAVIVLDDETQTLGTDEDDVFNGTPEAESYAGLGGDDRLFGLDGEDTLMGGAGDDLVIGGKGADGLAAGSGTDLLIGETVGDRTATTIAKVVRLYQATLDRAPDLQGLARWTQEIDAGTKTLAQVASGFVNSPEFKATYGTTTNEEFVTLLYNNVLGRDPDAQGLKNWTERLDNGMARNEAVTGFSQSPEFKTATSELASAFAEAGGSEWVDDVYRVYLATLDRAPDLTGLSRWVRDMGAGLELEEVISGFVNSPEFKATYGSTSNEEFVQLLYKNVLDRDADATGLKNWTERLDNGESRESVVRGFSQSPEFIANTAADVSTFIEAQEGDYFFAGTGSNVLYGSIAADTFAFHAAQPGKSTVLQLDSWDQIELVEFGYADRAEALEHMVEVGDTVVFSDQGVTAVFADTTIADLPEITFGL